MAWETRKGRKFFYTSQRDGNKVRKVYVGCGDAGRAAELAIELRRERRQRVREWLRHAATKFAELDVIDAELAVGLAAVLFAECGIRMDARAARTIIRKQGESVMEETASEPSLSPEDRAKWAQLQVLASRGDRAAAATLLVFLDRYPKLRERWGDLSVLALNKWLKLVAGRDEVAEATTCSKVMDLVSSLRRDKTDPLEKLLARRVGLLWLQTHYIDLQLASATSRSPEEQALLAKRQQTTQPVYSAAIRALQEYQARADAPHRPPARKRAPK